MRISLIEVQKIENFLLGSDIPSEQLVMEARIILDSDVADKVSWQRKTYHLVHDYGREKLREEIRAIDHKLFSDRKYQTFQDRIRSIFER